MKQHQLSLATVTSALRILEEQEFVEPQSKAGYFVKSRDNTKRVNVGIRATSSSFPNISRWGQRKTFFLKNAGNS